MLEQLNSNELRNKALNIVITTLHEYIQQHNYHDAFALLEIVCPYLDITQLNEMKDTLQSLRLLFELQRPIVHLDDDIYRDPYQLWYGIDITHYLHMIERYLEIRKMRKS